MLEKRHAEISGAGFGGLVAAIGLADRGWTVRVHERRNSLNAEGYGIAIQDNMVCIFNALGILNPILAGGIEIDYRDSVNANGKLILRLKSGLGRYRISRRHIISLLAQRAENVGVEILTGSNVTEANPKGEIFLANGKVHQADLIIAADGINSRIRDCLDLTYSQVFQKEGGTRMVIPSLPKDMPANPSDGIAMVEAWADNRRILYCPNSKSEIYAIFTCMADDSAGRTTPINVSSWKKSFPTLEPLIERFAKNAQWNESRWAQFKTIRLKRWSEGKIAILGDAAHAMPPYLGQGAGHAMMNGLGLSVALNETKDLKSALNIWENRERPLTEHTQKWTRLYGTTIYLPKLLKPLAINAERKIPWLASQYSRAARHIPTGCKKFNNIKLLS
ncbi:MAG: monooxygenase [Rhodospirillaceae bacterium]|nr:monooxygenase [Rhodospirillaceae bacterium]|tara:strand:- start:3255 stop:4427 length:1173 start_codon:yes stop_codon:yes gene_type:complete